MQHLDRRRHGAATTSARTIVWATVAMLVLAATLGTSGGVLAAGPAPSVAPAPSVEPEPSVEPAPGVDPEPSPQPESSVEPEPSAELPADEYPDPATDPDPNDEHGGPRGVCGCTGESPADRGSSPSREQDVLGAAGLPPAPGITPPPTDEASPSASPSGDTTAMLALVGLAGFIAFGIASGPSRRRRADPPHRG